MKSVVAAGDRRRTQLISALLGLALGDAYGNAVAAGRDPFVTRDGGNITDATQLALATCEAILRGRIRMRAGEQPSLSDQVHQSLLRWALVQPGIDLPKEVRLTTRATAWLSAQPLMTRGRRAGTATIAALMESPGLIARNSSNVLPRMVPLGLWDGWAGDARAIAAITHGGEDAALAADALVQLTIRLRTGEKLVHALDSIPAVSITDASQNCWLAKDALAAAVSAATSSRDLDAALATAADRAGNNAPVVCSLVGAFVALEVASSDYHEYGQVPIDGLVWPGTQQLPSSWLEGLEGRELMQRVASDFSRITAPDYVLSADDVMRYPFV